MTSSNYQPKIKRILRQHGYLLLAYAALAIVLTWPTIANLTTHLPGDGGDDPAIAWNLWWVKYALLNEGQNPFLTDFMFYPVGINLAFYTLTVLNAITALPLLLNFGVITASNLHMLFTFVAGAYGTFLLVKYTLVATTSHNESVNSQLIWLSAAIAGGFYAFASNKLFYVALGQFNIASNHWIPFAVLYVIRTGRQPRRLKNPIMAGLFLTMQAWAEITYATFLLIFIGLYWLYWLLVSILDRNAAGQGRNRPQALTPHAWATVVMALTFALGLTPILAQMLPDMRTEGDFLVEGSGFAGAFSADLLGFIVPTVYHPWWGHVITHTDIAFGVGQHVYVGVVLLGLMLVTLLTGFRNHVIRFWLVATAVFALLCLGPVVTMNGQSSGIPGPFMLVQQLPFFKGNRYPSRYSVMLILSLSMLSGFALVQIGRWFNRRSSLRPVHFAYLLLGLLALIFLFEHLALPLPQSDMTVPGPYQLIAGDPADSTVLDIPFAWRNGFRITGPLTTQFMVGQFYQTFHQKRLLQGNTSRNPAFKFQYFTEAPVINSLLALTTGKTLPADRWDSDQAIAADVFRFFNIKHVVVRPYQYDTFDGAQNITVTEQAAIPYLETILPVEKISTEADLNVYRVQDFQSGESGVQPDLLIDTGSPLAALYFGEGWGYLNPGQPIAAQRQEVRLLLPLARGPQRITLRMRLPGEAKIQDQSVSLELNGWQAAPQPVSQAWQEITFELPAGLAGPGANDIRLHFAKAVSLDQSMDTPIPGITVLSAGEEVGDFGHIFVNGSQVSPNQRGYNVALIQPDGRVVATANFDTHLDPAASTALADFIATVPSDVFIAVAAADEASASLSEAAVLALQSIGAAGDLRNCFRCSHAVLYDPLSGDTLEALDELRPVGVAVGMGLTEPSLAAEIDWIRVEPVEK